MRIVLLTSMGGNSGMGHATRCLSLANELDSRGADILFLTHTPVLERFVAPFKCAHHDSVNHDELQSGDILVVDCKDAILSAENYVSLRMGGAKVVRIDHPSARSDSCDLCVIPNAHQPKELQAQLRKRFGDRLLIGWDYIMLDSEVSRSSVIDYEWRGNGVIVFCAGGSDPTEALPRMMRDIRGNEETWELPKILAYGSHKSYSMRKGPYATYGYRCTEFQRTMIREAAMVVGMFGQTAYECIYWGTPMLCFGHNAENVYASMELMVSSKNAIQGYCASLHGKCAFFPAIDGEAFSGLVLESYLNKTFLLKMHRAGNGLIDGLGVQRIASAILSL